MIDERKHNLNPVPYILNLKNTIFYIFNRSKIHLERYAILLPTPILSQKCHFGASVSGCAQKVNPHEIITIQDRGPIFSLYVLEWSIFTI